MSKAVNLGTLADDISVSNGTIAVNNLSLGNSINFDTAANNVISGDKIHGGTISGFRSTGITDNANSTAITIDSSGYRLLVEGDNGYSGIEIKNQAADNVNILFRNPTKTQEIYMNADGRLYVGYDSNGEAAIEIEPHSDAYHKSVIIQNSHYLRQSINYKKVLYKNAGASAQTHRIARMRKHYWGGGILKLEIHKVYYTGYEHGVFICDGHTRHTHGPYVSVRTISNNNGCPTPYWGSIVNVSQEEGYADLYINVPAYYGYSIVCEVNGGNVVEDDDMYTGVGANIFYIDG